MAEHIVAGSGDQSVFRFPSEALALYGRRFRLVVGFSESARQGAFGEVCDLVFRSGRWCVGVLLGEEDADPIPDTVYWDVCDFLRCAEVHPQFAVESDKPVVEPLALVGRCFRVLQHGLLLDRGTVGYVHSVAFDVRGQWQALLGSGHFDGSDPGLYFDDVFQVLASVELLDSEPLFRDLGVSVGGAL